MNRTHGTENGQGGRPRNQMPGQSQPARGNPHLSRLFNTPASEPLSQDDDASVVLLRVVPLKARRVATPARRDSLERRDSPPFLSPSRNTRSPATSPQYPADIGMQRRPSSATPAPSTSRNNSGQAGSRSPSMIAEVTQNFVQPPVMSPPLPRPQSSTPTAAVPLNAPRSSPVIQVQPTNVLQLNASTSATYAAPAPQSLFTGNTQSQQAQKEIQRQKNAATTQLQQNVRRLQEAVATSAQAQLEPGNIASPGKSHIRVHRPAANPSSRPQFVQETVRTNAPQPAGLLSPRAAASPPQPLQPAPQTASSVPTKLPEVLQKQRPSAPPQYTRPGQQAAASRPYPFPQLAAAAMPQQIQKAPQMNNVGPSQHPSNTLGQPKGILVNPARREQQVQPQAKPSTSAAAVQRNTNGPFRVTSNEGAKKRPAPQNTEAYKPPQKKRVHFPTTVATTNQVPASSRNPSAATTQAHSSHLATAGEILKNMDPNKSKRQPVASTSNQPTPSTSEAISPPAVASNRASVPATVAKPAQNTHANTASGSNVNNKASTSKSAHQSSSSSHSSPEDLSDELEKAIDEAKQAFGAQASNRAYTKVPNKAKAIKYLREFAQRIPRDRSGLEDILGLYSRIDPDNYERKIEKAFYRIQERKQEKENERKIKSVMDQLKKAEEQMECMRCELPANEDHWNTLQKAAYKLTKDKFLQLYQEYLNLTGDGCEARNQAHKHLLQPLDLTKATPYPAINLVVQEHVNASKEEFKHSLDVSVDEVHSPPFKDIQEIVENAVKEFKLALTKDVVDKIVRDIYKAIILQNQAARSEDSWEEVCDIVGIPEKDVREQVLSADPANNDEELQEQLWRNARRGEANMAGLVDTYADHYAQIGTERDDDADSIYTEMDSDFPAEDSCDLDGLIAGPDTMDDSHQVPSGYTLSIPEDIHNEDTQIAGPSDHRATCTSSAEEGREFATSTRMNLGTEDNGNFRFFDESGHLR